MIKVKNIKLLSLLFLLIGLIVFTAMHPLYPSLDIKSHMVLSLIILVTTLWILKPLEIPFSVSSCLFLAILLILKIPAGVIFIGFTGSAIWTLIPAFLLGTALSKSHLGERITYRLMHYTKKTIPSIILSLSIIGIILSILTPSITVRIVIMMPIILGLVETYKLREQTVERSVVMISAWIMAVIPGTAWMSGSLNGPILTNFYSTISDNYLPTSYDWVKVAFLPVMLTTVLTLLIGYVFLKPRKDRFALKDMNDKYSVQCNGTHSKEIITAIVLILCFLFFFTKSFHGIPESATCLISLFLLSCFGLITKEDINKSVNWDLIIFIGTAMSFGEIVDFMGITPWLSSVLFSALSTFSNYPWMLLLVAFVGMFIWRFIDVAIFIPTMSIVVSLSPVLFESCGIHPYIWIPLLCLASNSFFMSYTNTFILMAESILQDGGWTKKHLFKYSIAYVISSIIVILISIPYWSKMGYL